MDTTKAQESLQQEEERLLKEMRSIGRENPATPGGWEPLPAEQEFEPDPLDRAEIASAKEDTAAVLADLEARRKRVAEALSRIGEGTYGVCEVCGAPVEPGRLLADPAATTCTEHM